MTSRVYILVCLVLLYQESYQTLIDTTDCIVSKMSNDSKEEGKRIAGYQAVDEEVKSGMKIGIGSGSTIVYTVQRLAQIYHEGKIKDIICVPTSFQAKQLITENKLPLGSLDTQPELDIAIDGADSVDPFLNVIKGGGGACLQEKVVAYNAKKFIVIVDQSKICTYLGENWTNGLPMEVLPMAYVPIINKIQKLYGVKAELRMAVKKAGPVVTDNSNFLLDVHFDWAKVTSESLYDLDSTLLKIPGVIETGFFVGMAEVVYIGKTDGTFSVMRKQQN